jgi:hypothetical protein
MPPCKPSILLLIARAMLFVGVCTFSPIAVLHSQTLKPERSGEPLGGVETNCTRILLRNPGKVPYETEVRVAAEQDGVQACLAVVLRTLEEPEQAPYWRAAVFAAGFLMENTEDEKTLKALERLLLFDIPSDLIDPRYLEFARQQAAVAIPQIVTPNPNGNNLPGEQSERFNATIRRLACLSFPPDLKGSKLRATSPSCNRDDPKLLTEPSTLRSQMLAVRTLVGLQESGKEFLSSQLLTISRRHPDQSVRLLAETALKR